VFVFGGPVNAKFASGRHSRQPTQPNAKAWCTYHLSLVDNPPPTREVSSFFSFRVDFVAQLRPTKGTPAVTSNTGLERGQAQRATSSTPFWQAVA